MRLFALRLVLFCLLLFLLGERASARQLVARQLVAEQSIYAASSLAYPLEQVLKDYSARTGVRPIIIYGSSALLARQIKQKAHADIFITAHRGWLNQITYQQAEPFINNRLVLVSSPLSHRGAQFTKRDIKTLLLEMKAKNQRLALSSPPVPAGLYAVQALKHFNLWDEARALSIFSHSAQMTLTWLLQNRAAAGIVYQSDVRLYPALKSLYTFPPQSHEPITYYIARLNHDPATIDLWRYLQNNKHKLYDLGFSQ